MFVYDALIDTAILEWARPDAVLEYAGKRGGKPSPLQRNVTLRCQLTAENKRVLRLRGGIPLSLAVAAKKHRTCSGRRAVAHPSVCQQVSAGWPMPVFP